MRAAVITGIGSVEVSTVDDPAPGPRDVVVAVAACGLCGTDLHILRGEFAPTLPVIPGHEFAGEIVAV
ncbi:MAG TPA: alcohol dehydrogenase catalytic domain-containing protein, partial [Rugosimonospora sp.]|nr:alcohol dehydrogenase catalytic domain-containing protein [Rugosimonospora sp.]